MGCYKLCILCSDCKLKEEFPEKLTSKCDHTPMVCIADTERWIELQFSRLSWGAMVCPQCPEVMQRDDIKRLAAPAVFQKCVKRSKDIFFPFVSCYKASIYPVAS